MNHTIQQPATIGIDLGKSTMHLHAVDQHRRVLWRKTLKRDELKPFLRDLQPCLIGIEASGGSHYWYRILSELNHTVHMISPQRVKAFIEGQKNDKNDATAIAQAVKNQQTRIIPPKTIQQQEIGSLHAMRSVKIRQRTQLINHMRGIMNEYGISCKIGATWFENHISEIMEKALTSNAFPNLVKNELLLQIKDLENMNQRIGEAEKHLLKIAKEDPCKRLMTIPGIGFLTSTMLFGHAGNVEYYKTARDFAASLGLVPRQYSTGGKQIYGRISKRGNVVLRSNLVQGSCSALKAALQKREKGISAENTLLEWALRCYDRKGMSRTVVALANKISRISWKILKYDGMIFIAQPSQLSMQDKKEDAKE